MGPFLMVAEAIPNTEIETPVQEQPTEAAPPSTEAALASTGEDAGVSTDGQVQEAFDVTALPEWQQAVGSQEESKAKATLPGFSQSEVEQAAAIQRSQGYQRILRQGDATVRNAMAQAGFVNEADQQAVWQIVSPLLNQMHGNSDSYYQAILNDSIAQALPETDREEFFKRVYPTYPDAFKAIHALGTQSKDAEWQAKVKAGDYVSKEHVKKIAEASFNAGRGIREKNGDVAGREGNIANGSSPTGVPSLRQWNAMTLEQRESHRTRDPNIEAKIR